VRLENTPIFYNIQALHIVKTVTDTPDWGDRLAGFGTVLILNATKHKVCVREILGNSAVVGGKSNYRKR
jgi:hypothetical protein